LGSTELTLEHVIPGSIGGRLTCRFVCSSCNSKLGHTVEADVKADPTIRFLAAHLKSSIPQLASRLAENQAYVSSGPGGKAHGRVKNGEFVVRSQKLADGSLIQPTTVAAKSLRRMLLRENHDEAAIEAGLDVFALAPENTRVALSQTIDVIKWSIDTVRPVWDGPLLNSISPLKSAFEFLALHLGTSVYRDDPPLAAIRRLILGQAVVGSHIQVERLHAPEAKPFHGLLFEGNMPHAVVQLRLFGQLAFRVHFKTLSVAGPQFVYTHDLVDNTEHVAHSASSQTDG
jgi:hypothetical protein